MSLWLYSIILINYIVSFDGWKSFKLEFSYDIITVVVKVVEKVRLYLLYLKWV